jgi:hypothetical protein
MVKLKVVAARPEIPMKSPLKDLEDSTAVHIFDELRKEMRIPTDLLKGTPTVTRRGGSNGDYIYVKCGCDVSKLGIFEWVIASCDIEFSIASYSKPDEVGYWGRAQLHYKHPDGGSNGSEVGSYNLDGEFKILKSSVNRDRSSSATRWD